MAGPLVTCGLLLLVLIAGAKPAVAQSFSTPNNYAVGDNPNNVAAGDFNGDGKPDLVTGNVMSQNVSVLLNNGNGTFQTAVNYTVDQHPEGITTGDFNNDGKVDLAAGNFLGGPIGAGNISILLGNGNGTFQSAVNFNASSPITLRTGDFNADGKLDIVTASLNTNNLSVLLGNGNGTFGAAVTYATGNSPWGVTVGDFNGDSKPDLASANQSGQNVSVLIGNGNGTFQAAVSYPAASGPTGIAAADISGDGKVDLLVTAAGSAAVLVLVGNGNGTFQTAVAYSVGSEPQRVDVADLNGDGKRDVVVVNANSASFSVLRGNGDGTLQPQTAYPARPNSLSLVLADFDADAKPDLAIVNNAFDLVDVWLNSPSMHSAAISATAGTSAMNVTVATFIDYDTNKTPDSFTASINWGDSAAPTAGTVSANAGGGFKVTGTHTYAREGSYNVTVQIADASGNFASTTSIATVADAPLTPTGKTFSPVRGVSFAGVVASFTDADPTGQVSDFSATINWGDSTAPTAGVISTNSGGGFDVGGTHTYATSGSFPVTVMIADVGGSTATANSTANVSLPVVQFSAASYSASEDANSVQITVTRTGGIGEVASVDFATSDISALEKSDYTTALGTLNFAGADTSKTFTVLLTDDVLVEGAETLRLTLSNPVNVILGPPSTVVLTINDNDTVPPTVNPLTDSQFFVRQHYHDFLNREPDTDGFQFWTHQIDDCGADAACRETKQINVSAAFFLSIEFQETGYLVYRTYKTAFGDTTSPTVAGTVPVIRFREFLPDTQQIGSGVQVGVGNWQQQLEANKVAYLLSFVQRARFITDFPLTMTADEFVTKLDDRAGHVLSAAEKSQLVSSLGATPGDAAKRASVVRTVAEDSDLRQQELNRAFVLMQYYGYLRRNPDDSPDANFGGWKFWLDKLNQFNGNFVQAEMVKAFLVSGEYRHRFGP